MEAKGSIFGINADWQAITLCLVAASTFWFFNAMNGDHTADVSYPIQFIYNKEKITPVNPLPEKVQFNASGFGWNLLRKTIKLNRKPIFVRINNLTSVKFITAEDLLPVVKSQLDDIKINYLLQDTIPLQFETVVIKSFPVRVDSTKISMLPGNEIVSPIKITPSTITLTGPSSMVNSLKDSFFVEIPERNIESDYEEDIILEFDLPSQVSYIPEDVLVAFDVAQFTQETVNVTPTLEGFPDWADIAGKDRIKLTVLIKPEDIDKLKNDDLISYVKFSSMAGDSTFPVQLKNPPPYIREYFFTPAFVEFDK